MVLYGIPRIKDTERGLRQFHQVTVAIQYP
jgi:hypothetical protein